MRHDQRTPYRRPRENKLKKLWAKPSRLSATATREHAFDEVDVPTIKLSTAFLVILFLHLALIAGVIIFRMLDRTELAEAGNGATTTASADPIPTAARPTAPAATSPTATASEEGVPMREAGAPTETRRHVVRNRESLDSIAAQYGVTREAIVQANGLGNSKPFAINLELLIPLPPREIRAERPGATPRDGEPEIRAARPVAGAPTATPATAAPATATRATPVAAARPVAPAQSSNAARTHTVQAGETLWGISRQYNITANALMQANGITDPARLQSGAVLRIP